ncbi:glutamine synthetase type III [Clostridiaceae bacterium AF29-16BH]|nr:glutamine synthetase type III [Clostridiales bacterium AM23-16LB]RHQ22336.1 glutamine synthetase type III [Clostridiaceae bacterium AF29-16BH]RHR46404.1 glutamine synthetase type III [Clostridiaceae bacterium AF18-31LB]RHT80419.1 glutamine synthetase type III [Clostridiaceae bacterium AM27-36LB]RHW02923.1 glutamine synthetase type III [Clostridiaceae bacterium OF09-1]
MERSMSVNVAEVFGQDVFNEAVMKERLPEVTYKQMVKLMNEGGEVTLELADIVAKAMKEWAIEKGATHYTHIFQPYIVSIGAEKHDSFADIPKGGKIENCFSGKDLMMGEPDASSFPSGGLRATCAARGYTAWDVGSPAYVKDGILCIPTAFCSYTGESLDTKTPLLKACDAVSKAGVRFVKMFGNTDAKRVSSYVGPEQEYFIVNREKYLERPDLIYAGRTLFGAPAPKGQEMEDQYFGPLKTKIADFMADVDEQLWKLGITVKTQHNEVAPGQHEIAPIFAPADAALDSNFLVMDVLKSTATKHGLACLLHEKPFAGVNGSGKHNNWSLGTDNGVNLFKPGKEPNKNLQFLCVLACLMEAVNKHALLLRAAASNTGNDHRLGANEAPPAIISIYMGDQLGEIVDAIVAGVPFDQLPCAEVGTLDLGVSTLPVLPKDPTDRNRTSPFAFTGNRFEFRMVASSVSIGDANTVMNSMMAESFNKACDALEGAEDFEKAAIDYIYKTMKENKNIVFNGNGYSDEWVEEAAKRGLPNVKSIVDAIPAYTDESSIEMFEKLGVMTKRELEARREIKLEEYAGLINIEARTMIDMAAKLYIPSVIAYVNSVASSMSTVKNAYAQADTTAQQTILVKASSLLADTQQALDNLKAATDAAETAKDFHEKVLPAMAALRTPVDELETIVDSEYWPVPTYGQMMFEV